MRDKSHDPPAPFEDAGAARAIEASLAGERGRGYGDMLRSVADWHWETDGELQLTQVSPGLTAALGTPGQILLGHSIFDLIDPQQRDAQAIRDAVDQQRAFRIDGLRLQGPNAGRTTWRITGIPYYATASGQFEFTPFFAFSAGKSAWFKAEQFTFKQTFRKRRTINFDKRFTQPR